MKNRFDDKYDKNPTNIKKMNFQFKNIISSPKYINNLIFNIKISNIKNKVHKIKTDKRKNIDNYARKIILNNINKYDAKKGEMEKNIINNLIKDKSTHIKSILEDYNIFNNYFEYLKAFYKLKKIIKNFPKFYAYYKNYFKFFLKPTLNDLNFCHILKKNGDNQAQDFYEKYKDKKNKLKMPNKKYKNYNKKMLITNLIEKNINNSFSNFLNENTTNFKNNSNTSGFSTISLLSLINLINNNNNKNNTSLNHIEKGKDYIPKKINLFLEFKNKNKISNNKNKKSTAILTPPNKINNLKIINSYDYKSSKPKIKNEKKNNFIFIFKKNNNNNEINNDTNRICFSERTNIEKNYKNNYKNILNEFKTKANYDQLNKQNLLSDNINIKTNTINKLYYNMKETSFTPTNRNSYLLSTQTSNSNWYNNCETNSNLLSQTQINKIKNKSPSFKTYNIRNNFMNKIKSKNIKYNTNINNKSNPHNLINSMKLQFKNRGGFNSSSFIFYQKIKNDNNIKFN